jgi:hypothetical protein
MDPYAMGAVPMNDTMGPMGPYPMDPYADPYYSPPVDPYYSPPVQPEITLHIPKHWVDSVANTLESAFSTFAKLFTNPPMSPEDIDDVKKEIKDEAEEFAVEMEPIVEQVDPVVEEIAEDVLPDKAAEKVEEAAEKVEKAMDGSSLAQKLPKLKKQRHVQSLAKSKRDVHPRRQEAQRDVQHGRASKDASAWQHSHASALAALKAERKQEKERRQKAFEASAPARKAAEKKARKTSATESK